MRRPGARLDDDIDTLQQARMTLAGATGCRYDHPLDECPVVNVEIDRRLEGRGRQRPAGLRPGPAASAPTGPTESPR
ncbi:MAG: hypothetical protein ACRCXL_03630 [Dermatophilaceae bacterium]